RLRRCCSLLHSLLRLSPADSAIAPAETVSNNSGGGGDGGGEAGDSNLGSSSQLGLIGLGFALANLRTSISGWFGGLQFTTIELETHIRGMGLNWIQLGTVYFAGLLCDYGFSSDILFATFPNVVTFGTMAAKEFLNHNTNRYEKDYQMTVDFMSCKAAELATAAARTVMRHPRLATVSSVHLFSDSMAAWILLLDDVRLFESFLKLRCDLGVPYAQNETDLLALAAKSGASRIAHALVFARTPPSATPSVISLETAIQLNRPSMVRLFVADAPTPLLPRRDLSTDFVTEIFRDEQFQTNCLESIEALLESGDAGLNATHVHTPDDVEYFGSGSGRLVLHWERRISRVRVSTDKVRLRKTFSKQPQRLVLL
ncbi:hypothetical protein HK405_011041, partial [Cladochytrium tenue]